MVSAFLFVTVTALPPSRDHFQELFHFWMWNKEIFTLQQELLEGAAALWDALVFSALTWGQGQHQKFLKSGSIHGQGFNLNSHPGEILGKVAFVCLQQGDAAGCCFLHLLPGQGVAMTG